jgi:chromosome segregation ATPase
MSNTINHNIEYYKSELVKKDEVIEKLFEEVDNLKDSRQEQNEIIKDLQKQIENNWKLRVMEYENQLRELKIENEKLKIENEKFVKRERRRNVDFFCLKTLDANVEDTKIMTSEETEEIEGFPIYPQSSSKFNPFLNKYPVKEETVIPENYYEFRYGGSVDLHDRYHKRRAVYLK